jgi:hypothetical protein
VKIISHFFLAMPASLTAIRDSGDSKRGNFLEKSFRSAINSGDPRPGKQREGLPAGTYQEINPRDKPKDKPKRKGPGKGTDREWNGMNGLELIPWEPIAIASKYPQQVASPLLRLLASLTGCLAKNSIITAV